MTASHVIVGHGEADVVVVLVGLVVRREADFVESVGPLLSEEVVQLHVPSEPGKTRVHHHQFYVLLSPWSY